MSNRAISSLNGFYFFKVREMVSSDTRIPDERSVPKEVGAIVVNRVPSSYNLIACSL